MMTKQTEALEQPEQEPLTSLDEIFADEMFRLNRDIMPLPEHLIHEIAQRNYHPELGINPVAFTLDVEKAHGIGKQACKQALEQPSVAELNDEYLRDTHVEGLQSAQEPVDENHISKALDFLDALPNGYLFQPIDQERFERYVGIISKQLEWLQGMCATYAERAVKDGEQKIKDAQAIKKLFAHPAPAWQGLSDGDIQEHLGDELVTLHGWSFVQGVRWANKKLKEKNNAVQ